MIKIEHPDILKISEKHWEACCNYILPRLNFVIDLFDALGNNNYQSSLNLNGLTIRPIRSILKPILKKSKQGLIKLDEIKPALLTGEKSCFDSKLAKRQIKNFHEVALYDALKPCERELDTILSEKLDNTTQIIFTQETIDILYFVLNR